MGAPRGEEAADDGINLEENTLANRGWYENGKERRRAMRSRQDTDGGCRSDGCLGLGSFG